MMSYWHYRPDEQPRRFINIYTYINMHIHFDMFIYVLYNSLLEYKKEDSI